MNLPSKYIGVDLGGGMTQMTATESKINEIITFLEEKYPQVKEEPNPECKICGLLKSTILSTGTLCVGNGLHDLRDEPKMKRIECEGVGDNNGFYEMSFPQPDEPSKCKHQFWKDRNPAGCMNCGKTEEELYAELSKSKELPHWESDYAAIWERLYSEQGYGTDAMRQDILELIHKLMKV